MRPALSSSPRDLAEWRMLIKNLMEHLKGTVWNQPDAALDFHPRGSAET